MAQTAQRQRFTTFSCYPLYIIDINRNGKQSKASGVRAYSDAPKVLNC